MYCLGVSRQFRGRGIATKLVQEAFLVAQKAECQSTSVFATNPASCKIFEKLNMEVIKVIKSISFVDDDDEIVFPKVDQFTAHFKLLYEIVHFYNSRIFFADFR
jgi:ribosomal protein S18 acetylase RimI-like enzyme